MLKNYFLVAFLALSLIPAGLNGQHGTGPFHFPDIPGYKTLVCDFHMHTVFSDGLVWPTVRIDEAVAEGLDAISITDHIEYLPHSDDLSGDHNRAYEIAKPRADKNDLILIRGAEITRSMPPGHFNAIFLEDANTLDTETWQDAIRIANEQGAFVFWNHPGWRQDEEIPLWYAEHSWLLEREWIQGIEVVNENSYYPLAFQWAQDSNLTIIGNSDIHDPLDMFFNKCEGEHRPVTLVFVKESSAEGIREALDNRRTAIYHQNILIGSEEFLKPLFEEAVTEITKMVTGGNEKAVHYLINSSCFTFEIVYADQKGIESEPIFLAPDVHYESQTSILHNYKRLVVKNIFVAPGKNLVIIH